MLPAPYSCVHTIKRIAQCSSSSWTHTHTTPQQNRAIIINGRDCRRRCRRMRNHLNDVSCRWLSVYILSRNTRLPRPKRVLQRRQNNNKINPQYIWVTKPLCVYYVCVWWREMVKESWYALRFSRIVLFDLVCDGFGGTWDLGWDSEDDECHPASSEPAIWSRRKYGVSGCVVWCVDVEFISIGGERVS